MKRSVWWPCAVVLVLAGGLLVGGCSKKQVRQESGAPLAPSAEAGRVESGTGAPAEQNLPSAGGEASRAAPSPSGNGAPEAPPKAIASQVEMKGPDVQKPAVTVPGTSESAPGLKRIHFDFDRSSITAESKATLEKNAKFLMANPGLRIRVEGHCDERGTTEYNIALGERRAKAAFQYLMDLGVDPNRMSTTSFGKEAPLDPGHNEQAWAKNRRAEFVKVQ